MKSSSKLFLKLSPFSIIQKVQNHSKYRYLSTRLFASTSANSNAVLYLEFVGEKWNADKDVIESTDMFILRSKEFFQLFICPDDRCGYNTNLKQSSDRHMESCGKESLVTYQQKMMTEEHIRTWCVQQGYIDADYHQVEFIAFDIETLSKPVQLEMTNNSFMYNTQRVVTIAVTKSWGEQSKKSIVFRRN